METQGGGGVMDSPLIGGVGYADWATMSGMSPAAPLVGGQPGHAGYGAGQRQVAVAQQSATLPAAAGHPAAANWRELFNLKGNPVGWVCLATIAYLGLTHMSYRKGGRR